MRDEVVDPRRVEGMVIERPHDVAAEHRVAQQRTEHRPPAEVVALDLPEREEHGDGALLARGRGEGVGGDVGREAFEGPRGVEEVHGPRAEGERAQRVGRGLAVEERRERFELGGREVLLRVEEGAGDVKASRVVRLAKAREGQRAHPGVTNARAHGVEEAPAPRVGDGLHRAVGLRVRAPLRGGERVVGELIPGRDAHVGAGGEREVAAQKIDHRGRRVGEGALDVGVAAAHAEVLLHRCEEGIFDRELGEFAGHLVAPARVDRGGGLLLLRRHRATVSHLGYVSLRRDARRTPCARPLPCG